MDHLSVLRRVPPQIGRETNWLLRPRRVRPLMFASNRFTVLQNNNQATAGFESCLSHIFTGLPPYATSDVRLYYANWWIASDGTTLPERDGSNALTIDFATVFVGGVAWPVSFAGASSITLQPGQGIWATVPGLTPAASAGAFVRTSATVATSAFRPAGYRPQNSTSLGDAVEYTATPQTAKATSGTVSGVASGANVRCYGPTQMVARGWDGRPVLLCLGDSIGQGAADSILTTDTRGTIGYLARGLDDTGSTRMPFGMLCAAGTAPSQTTGITAGNFLRRYQMLAALPNWPFTSIVSQHGVNEMALLASATDEAGFEAAMNGWWQFIKATWPGFKLTQTTLTPRVQTALNSSFWTDQANQSPSAVDVYPTGARWTGNTFIRTKPAPVDALIDVTASFQDATNLDHWPTPGTTWTTTTATVVNGTTVTVSGAGAPPQGDQLVFEAGTANAEAFLGVATGTGPWTFTLGPGGKFTKVHAIGTTAVLSLSADGTHPLHQLHTNAMAPVITAKNAGVFA